MTDIVDFGMTVAGYMLIFVIVLSPLIILFLTKKTCPFCRKRIQRSAFVCPHCTRQLKPVI